MSPTDAVYALEEQAAGRTPGRALALDALAQRGTVDRDILDAAAGLSSQQTDSPMDLDEAGRRRAAQLAEQVRAAARATGQGISFATLSLMALIAFVVSGCGTYYVPKPSVSRPPAVTVANTPEAQACLRELMQTHEICRGNCRRPYTQYNGHEVERETQQCVTACDDSRDAALKTCPQ